MLVYVVPLWVALSVPVAAGLMLLFPALNGLGLFFEGDSAPEIARTMILLPLINGLLCVTYICMGGFPIVPFGGLISLSSGQETLAGIGALHQMAGSVWASPIVPIWFIVFFSRYLALTRSVALQLLGLFAGWAGCLIAIAGISWLLLKLQ
jgi:hypothetical protein